MVWLIELLQWPVKNHYLAITFFLLGLLTWNFGDPFLIQKHPCMQKIKSFRWKLSEKSGKNFFRDQYRLKSLLGYNIFLLGLLAWNFGDPFLIQKHPCMQKIKSFQWKLSEKSGKNFFRDPYRLKSPAPFTKQKQTKQPCYLTDGIGIDGM